MAEAYGKLTGRPGICFVTRGPGATNASIGVHTAFQDSTPMILFIGQVARDQRGARGVPGDRLPPHVRPDGQMGRRRSTTPRASRNMSASAFHRAVNGRPGPGGAGAARGHADRHASTSPTPAATSRSSPSPAPRQMHDLRELLDEAKRPLMVLGGGGWTAEAVRRHPRLCRGGRSAGRLLLPLPGPVRQPPPELRGRRRHRHQPEARRAREERRPAARRRRRGWAR